MRTWRNHMEFEVLHMKATLSHGMVGGCMRYPRADEEPSGGRPPAPPGSAAVRDQRRTFSGAGDGAPAAGAVTASR